MLARHDDIDNTGRPYPLHTFINTCKDPLEFNSFVKTWSTETISAFAKTIDNKGCLPYERIAKNKFLSADDKTLLSEALYPYTCNQTHPSLNSTVEIPERYNTLPKDSRLFKNLKHAVIVANLVRKRLTASSSHPDANAQDAKWVDEINDKILSIRSRIKKMNRNAFMWAKEKYFSINEEVITLEIANKVYQRLATAIFDLYLQERNGNCEEFSWLTFYYWHLLKITTPAEVFEILRGDHLFLVIDRETQRNQPEEWGENTVICDPWAGKVYLASELQSNLKAYLALTINNNEFYSLLIDFNPYYHELRPFPLIDRHLQFNIHRSLNFARYFLCSGQFENLTLKEKVLFERKIYPKVRLGLRYETITETQIYQLTSPFKTLITIFSNKIALKMLYFKLVTLKMLENLPPASLGMLLTDDGFKALVELSKKEEKIEKSSTNKKANLHNSAFTLLGTRAAVEHKNTSQFSSKKSLS